MSYPLITAKQNTVKNVIRKGVSQIGTKSKKQKCIAEVIAVADQKGGVAKTTTAIALGQGLALKGFRVLFVDLDPSGNLSLILQANRNVESVYDLLEFRRRASTAIQNLPGGDVIPSSKLLTQADKKINGVGTEYRLKEAIQPQLEQYEYIIIDTPPSLGILTINALTAADYVVIPAQADYLSIDAIDEISNTIKAVQHYTNSSLRVRGILLTRHNSRSILSRDLTEEIRARAKGMGTFLYKTVIRESVVVKEAQACHLDIYSYAPCSNPAIDYDAFVDEFISSGNGSKLKGGK